jgi:cytochrome c553
LVLAGLTLLLAGSFAAAVVGYVKFAERRERTFATGTALPLVRADRAALDRGQHLARTLGGCAKCHGEDFGGQVMVDTAVMRVVAPNLTPGRGSVVRGFADRDWLRAILSGTAQDGRSLLIMPAKELRSLADEDVSSLVAFARTLPPVNRDLGKSEVSLLGAVVLGLTNAPLFSAEGFDHGHRHAPAVEAGPTPEYGLYLARTCRGCHGDDLQGGTQIEPGGPPSADISARAMKHWSFAQFERALRAGKRRDGSDLHPSMPWRATSGLSAEEMRALWLGLCQE